MITQKEKTCKYLLTRLGKEIKFLNKRKLEEAIGENGNYGIDVEYILKKAGTKIKLTSFIHPDGRSVNIYRDGYNWPWWFFETAETGQLEFDF